MAKNSLAMVDSSNHEKDTILSSDEQRKAQLVTAASWRKVSVIYYLSRGGGQLDQPHLLEGYLSPGQVGLRLRDVKRWLAALRGKSMPESYSWSYKRSFKNGFIWHDLNENDIIIQPLGKTEYVLMGSEIRANNNNACHCGEKLERSTTKDSVDGIPNPSISDVALRRNTAADYTSNTEELSSSKRFNGLPSSTIDGRTARSDVNSRQISILNASAAFDGSRRSPPTLLSTAKLIDGNRRQKNEIGSGRNRSPSSLASTTTKIIDGNRRSSSSSSSSAKIIDANLRRTTTNENGGSNRSPSHMHLRSSANSKHGSRRFDLTAAELQPHEYGVSYSDAAGISRRNEAAATSSAYCNNQYGGAIMSSPIHDISAGGYRSGRDSVDGSIRSHNEQLAPPPASLQSGYLRHRSTDGGAADGYTKHGGRGRRKTDLADSNCIHMDVGTQTGDSRRCSVDRRSNDSNSDGDEEDEWRRRTVILELSPANGGGRGGAAMAMQRSSDGENRFIGKNDKWRRWHGDGDGDGLGFAEEAEFGNLTEMERASSMSTTRSSGKKKKKKKEGDINYGRRSLTSSTAMMSPGAASVSSAVSSTSRSRMIHLHSGGAATDTGGAAFPASPYGGGAAHSWGELAIENDKMATRSCNNTNSDHYQEKQQQSRRHIHTLENRSRELLHHHPRHQQHSASHGGGGGGGGGGAGSSLQLLKHLWTACSNVEVVSKQNPSAPPSNYSGEAANYSGNGGGEGGGWRRKELWYSEGGSVRSSESRVQRRSTAEEAATPRSSSGQGGWEGRGAAEAAAIGRRSCSVVAKKGGGNANEGSFAAAGIQSCGCSSSTSPRNSLRELGDIFYQNLECSRNPRRRPAHLLMESDLAQLNHHLNLLNSTCIGLNPNIDLQNNANRDHVHPNPAAMVPQSTDFYHDQSILAASSCSSSILSLQESIMNEVRNHRLAAAAAAAAAAHHHHHHPLPSPPPSSSVSLAAAMSDTEQVLKNSSKKKLQLLNMEKMTKKNKQKSSENIKKMDEAAAAGPGLGPSAAGAMNIHSINGNGHTSSSYGLVKNHSAALISSSSNASSSWRDLFWSPRSSKSDHEKRSMKP